MATKISFTFKITFYFFNNNELNSIQDRVEGACRRSRIKSVIPTDVYQWKKSFGPNRENVSAIMLALFVHLRSLDSRALAFLSTTYSGCFLGVIK